MGQLARVRYGPRSLRVFGTDTDDVERVAELVRDLHPPIAAGLQLAVQALENLPGGNCRLFPRRLPVRQFFPDLIWLGAIMIDVEEVPGHQNQRGILCLVPDIRVLLPLDTDCGGSAPGLRLLHCWPRPWASATERGARSRLMSCGSDPMTKSNALLMSFSDRDMDALTPFLKTVQLNSHQVLAETGDTISLAYFPTTCVISLVVVLSSGELIEAAMVGRDGVVGGAGALDGKMSLCRAVVQLPGEAVTCSVDGLSTAAFQSRSLISVLVRHEQTLYAQAQQSTACMAAHQIEARFARWLLRARDLAGSDALPFTQEFLAEMLGVQRTSISPVAHTFQRAGIIRYARGKIEILDVEALRESACECYETVRSQYQALLGTTIARRSTT